jgi:hypothetical protein
VAWTSCAAAIGGGKVCALVAAATEAGAAAASVVAGRLKVSWARTRCSSASSEAFHPQSEQIRKKPPVLAVGAHPAYLGRGQVGEAPTKQACRHYGGGVETRHLGAFGGKRERDRFEDPEDNRNGSRSCDKAEPAGAFVRTCGKLELPSKLAPNHPSGSLSTRSRRFLFASKLYHKTAGDALFFGVCADFAPVPRAV